MLSVLGAVPWLLSEATSPPSSAAQVWLVDMLWGGHTLVGVCDATGEDMACHNSMCHLGLCSSCEWRATGGGRLGE